MNNPSNQFGLLVAYLLPGFVVLAGLAPFAPIISAWLLPGNYTEASLAPPVYVLLAATTLGMIASAFRWLLIDQIHRLTGLTPPVWDDSRLSERLPAFNYLVESHYRYYQFVANLLVAVLFAYILNRILGRSPVFGIASDIGVLILSITLFAASRDALTKYYARTGRLVGPVAEKGFYGDMMYNGNDHAAEGGKSSKPATPSKSGAKPKPEVRLEQQNRSKANSQAK